MAAMFASIAQSFCQQSCERGGNLDVVLVMERYQEMDKGDSLYVLVRKTG